MWCLLRRLFYTRSAHPPNRPKTPTKPLSVPFTPWARDPTEHAPTPFSPRFAASLRGRAVSTASTKPWDFCAVSAPSRSRPLRGLLRAAFAGCLCAEMLLLALPLPPRPNMAGYFQQPAILWPWREGGASKRGAPTPCPRRPAPPTSLWRAFVAGSLHPQTRHTIRQRKAVLRSEPSVPSVPSRAQRYRAAQRLSTPDTVGSPLRTARGLPQSPRPLTPAPWSRFALPLLLRCAFASVSGQ